MKSETDKERPRRKKNGTNNARWIIQVFFITLFLSGLITMASESVLDSASLWVAITVLLLLIALGVVFDMIGVAITSAQEAPFVAMAAKRVRGAKHSLYILQHTDRFASFCNDIVGDICGIVSGTAGAVIAGLLTMHFGLLAASMWAVITSAAISALTVSFKALGKGLAIRKSKNIVRLAGIAISFIPLKK